MRNPAETEPRMTVRGALQVLADVRDATTIVVTHQGSARVWPQIANHALDFHYNPSTMGGAVPFGLGLAIANPTRSVIVVSGDGALAMSLGSLISVVAANAANLTVVVLDNEIYEVTGGQITAAAEAQVSFAGIAASIGFPSTSNFSEETAWREQAGAVMASAGPRFISLRVERALPDDMATSLPSISQRLAQFSQAVQA